MPLLAPRLVSVLLCLACAAFLAACGRSEQVFQVRGIVRGPVEDGTITIEHETIPNFMPAMTMPFNVDPAEVRDLAPGDRVEFEFRVGERSRATNFRKLAGSPAPEPSPARRTGANSSTSSRVREGDPVPAFSLVDQDDQPLTAENLRGHRTIVTFIFTRCPVPEFCPLIAKKFQTLQARLPQTPTPTDPAAPVQLLSITIDPEHDRPAVLRAYGESLGADFSRWRFATGETDEVMKLTRAFAVRTERNASTIDHTLATALIGPDGKVVSIWRGNAWKPEEVVAQLDLP